MRLLFVSWDGASTTYLESLFLPIFSELVKKGIQVHVIQFSWKTATQVQRISTLCEENSVKYVHRRAIRRPSVALGSLVTILSSILFLKRYVKSQKIDTVMPRSVLPALACLYTVKRDENIKFIFDADGLPLDERVEFSGADPTNIFYRFLRDVEFLAVQKAHNVATRSKRASEILFNRAGGSVRLDKFKVVGNGRDPRLFRCYGVEDRALVRRELGVELDSPLIVYAGSLENQYCMREMLYFYSLVFQNIPSARFLILSGDHSKFQSILSEFDDVAGNIILRFVDFDQVGRYLAASDLGLAIRSQSFSMSAVSPIKIGEYLMCGLPVIASAGVGDTDIISKEFGFVLKSNSERDLRLASRWFCETFASGNFDRRYISSFGVEKFSVNTTVKQYLDLLGVECESIGVDEVL